MVKYLGIHISAFTPWRCNQYWNPVTQANRTVRLQFIIYGNVNFCGNFTCVGSIRLRNYIGWHMVKISIIFIVSQDKNSLLPYLRIFGQDIHRLRTYQVPYKGELVWSKNYSSATSQETVGKFPLSTSDRN